MHIAERLREPPIPASARPKPVEKPKCSKGCGKDAVIDGMCSECALAESEKRPPQKAH